MKKYIEKMGEICVNKDCELYCVWEESKCSVTRDVTQCECRKDICEVEGEK